MGCDIHYVIERHVDKIWVGIIATEGPFIDYCTSEQFPIRKFKHRDYGFFARLAGVRGKGPSAKGIPANSSQLTRLVIKGSAFDYHSHSYCSLIEFAGKKLLGQDEINPIAAERLTGGTKALCKYLGMSDHEDLNLYRVVFWFDN